MTVLFTGSEREALQSGAVGNYGETSSGVTNPPSRGATNMTSGAIGTYTCTLSAAATELWARFKSSVDLFGAGSYTYSMVEFRDAADNVLVRLRAAAAVQTLQYWNGSTYVTVTPTIADASNLEFVVHMKKHASAGVVEFYRGTIGGAVSLIATSGPIALTSFGDITKVCFMYQGDRNRTYWGVICNDGAIGPIGWETTTRVPTGNGTDVDGTGDYLSVDELSLDTADFVAFSAAGEHRSFTNSVVTVLNEVQGVGVAGCIRRVDGTGPQSIKPYVKIAGVRYYGTTFALTTSFADYQYIWTVDPATGLEWNYLDAGSATYAEFGWEAVA